MSLTSSDLKQIKEILQSELKGLNKKLDTIDSRLTNIETRLDRIEKWVPVANTEVVKPVKKTSSASRVTA